MHQKCGHTVVFRLEDVKFTGSSRGVYTDHNGSPKLEVVFRSSKVRVANYYD